MSNSELKVTPSQTIGPFFRFGTEWIANENVVPKDTANAITLRGTVYDGAGEPVPDAMIEIFQADQGGKFPPNTASWWSGFARRLTDDNGSYQITTVKPGPVATSFAVMQAPHISVVVFARGLLKPVFTRIYFADEAEANASDPLLSVIENEQCRETLIATKDGQQEYVFDVRLQDSKRGIETQFVIYGQ